MLGAELGEDPGEELDPVAFKFKYVKDETTYYPIKFFVKGDPYSMLGFIKSDVHLFGLDAPHRVYPLGPTRWAAAC